MCTTISTVAPLESLTLTHHVCWHDQTAVIAAPPAATGMYQLQLPRYPSSHGAAAPVPHGSLPVTQLLV